MTQNEENNGPVAANATKKTKSSASKSGEATTSSKSKSGKKQAQRRHREFNSRWFVYLASAAFGLLGITSLSAVEPTETLGQISSAEKITGLIFAVTSFVVNLVVIIADFFYSKVPLGSEPGGLLDFKNIEGHTEGYLLTALTVWWIGGVIATTKTGGIAYMALNIYFSIWIEFFLSAFALNEWAKEKEIISFRELTHLSQTLKGWYVHGFSSVVVLGSVADGVSSFRQDEGYISIIAVSMLAGLSSMILSLLFILAHYKLACCFCGHDLPVGGWVELAIAGVLVIVWLIEVTFATSYGGFAATITGMQCMAVEGEQQTAYPGSNVYIGSWVAFLSIGYVIMEWKAERALDFARTQEAAIEGSLTNKTTLGNQLAANTGDDNDI